MYIDDTTPVCVDLEGSDNIERLRQCSLLAINAASRDVHVNEPIPRVEQQEIPPIEEPDAYTPIPPPIERHAQGSTWRTSSSVINSHREMHLINEVGLNIIVNNIYP